MSDELKLGHTIDDYCSRCQLLMNHYVVSMVGRTQLPTWEGRQEEGLREVAL